MGAGILPVAINNNTVFILLGQEAYDKKWADFGGSPSPKTEAVFKTAIREGYEELDGFLGTKKELKKMVENNLIHITHIYLQSIMIHFCHRILIIIINL